MSTSSPIYLRRPWKLALMLGAAGLVSIALSDVFARFTFESLAPTRYISTSRSSSTREVVKPPSLVPSSWVDALESAERGLIQLAGGAMVLYGVWLVATPKRMARCPACGDDLLLRDDTELTCVECRADLRIDAEAVTVKA